MSSDRVHGRASTVAISASQCWQRPTMRPPLAAMVGAQARDHCHPACSGRSRRGGTRPRAAASVREQAGRAACPDRAPTSRRVTVRRPAGAVVRPPRAAFCRGPRTRLRGTGRCRLRSSDGLGSRTGRRLLAHPRVSARCASGLIGLVVLLAFVVPDGPFRLDKQWSELMHDAETSLLTHIALVFNAVGHGILRALTIAGVGLVLLIARRRAALLAFIVVEAMTPLLVNLIKLLVGRERPPGALIEAHGSSYPSGHAAYAGATTVMLVLLFTTPGRPRPRLVGRRRRGDRRDGLEPHLPGGALALGRTRWSHARYRRRPAQRGRRPDPLDEAARTARSAARAAATISARASSIEA